LAWRSPLKIFRAKPCIQWWLRLGPGLGHGFYSKKNQKINYSTVARNVRNTRNETVKGSSTKYYILVNTFIISIIEEKSTPTQ
jgi:hypothetical protein